MGAPKVTKNLFGEKSNNQVAREKQKAEVEMYRKKLQELLKNPKLAKKAAAIMEHWLKQSDARQEK